MPTKTIKQAAKKTAKPTSVVATIAPEPDLENALRLALQLMALPGPSCREGAVAEFIMERLREAGAPESAILLDNAHKKTPTPGEVGNLILKLPGTIKG